MMEMAGDHKALAILEFDSDTPQVASSTGRLIGGVSERLLS